MTVTNAHVRAKIERAQARLVQLQAREALMEMRRKTQAQGKARREQARRRMALGQVIDEAGMADWSKAELSGLLIRAREHFGDSEATRRMLAHRAGPSTMPDGHTVH